MEFEEGVNTIKRKNCCQRSIILYVVIPFGIILLLIGILVVGYIVYDNKLPEEEPTKKEPQEEQPPVTDISVCTEPECIKSAAEILDTIDELIDPCENFHDFVCGGFLKTAHESEMAFPYQRELARLSKKQDHFIIDPPVKGDLPVVFAQKKYFQACLNRGDQSKIFANLTEGFDWWQTFNPDDFHWMKAMIDARKLGMPFEWFLGVGLHESSQYELEITYPEDCGRLNPILGDENNIQNIIVFGKKLEQICDKSKEETISNGTISDLEKVWFKNGIGCLHFITSITGQAKKWRLDSNVTYHNYIVRLDRVLQETPKQVQAGYIKWKILDYFAPFLVYGEETSRFDFCLDDTKSRFQDVAIKAQITRLLSSNIEKEQELVHSIKEELLNQLRNIYWYDTKIKQKNLVFHQKLKEIVGGVEEIRNEELPSEWIVFTSNNIIDMLVLWSKKIFAFKMEKIGQPVQNQLIKTVYLANSLLTILVDKDQELLIVPVVFFDSYLYNSQKPNYLNFAGLGTSIASKLVENLLGLNEKFNQTYEEAADNENCLIDNLKGYKNDSFIFHNNYPSLIAQDIAYKAYQKWVEQNGEESRLIDIFTPNQLFWIRSSLDWCHTSDEETWKLRILEGVKNSDSFAKDFNCGQGSAMNPVKKCKLL